MRVEQLTGRGKVSVVNVLTHVDGVECTHQTRMMRRAFKTSLVVDKVFPVEARLLEKMPWMIGVDALC